MKKVLLFSICTVVILSMSSCASLVLGQYNPRNNPEVVIEGNVSEPVTITTSYKKYKDVRLPQRVEIDRHKIDGQHIKIESSNYVYQDIVIKKKRTLTEYKTYNYVRVRILLICSSFNTI